MCEGDEDDSAGDEDDGVNYEWDVCVGGGGGGSILTGWMCV